MPDGSAGQRAIAGPLPVMQVSLTSKLPAGLSATTGSRGVVILCPPLFYDHVPTETDLSTQPAVAAFTVTGTAVPLDGRYHPRQFSVAPTPATPSYVPLRPTPQATRIGEAGAVVLNLRWQTGAIASWAILMMSCVRNGVTLGFSGQADINGDVIVPLTGLPPLPASQTTDSMTLTAQGDATQSGQSIANPDVFKSVPISIGGAYAVQQTVAVKRGQISNLTVLGLPGVTLQPI
jgi:hypothetical protein